MLQMRIYGIPIMLKKKGSWSGGQWLKFSGAMCCEWRRKCQNVLLLIDNAIQCFVVGWIAMWAKWMHRERFSRLYARPSTGGFRPLSLLLSPTTSQEKALSPSIQNAHTVSNYNSPRVKLPLANFLGERLP